MLANAACSMALNTQQWLYDGGPRHASPWVVDELTVEVVTCTNNPTMGLVHHRKRTP